MGNRHKDTTRQKSAATKKAEFQPDPASLLPRHDWDEVARNWDALHGTATPVATPLDTLGVESVEAQDGGQSEVGPFSHSEDYRSVVIHGKGFTLTPKQAAIIRNLHRAYKNGTPDVAINTVMMTHKAESSRWQDTFKSSADAKKALIKSGNRKGTLRLNL